MVKRFVLALVILVLAALFVRLSGPSDLYDNDQPKTVAYTVDMVENGRWLVPHDMLGRPTTKPLLYNWIGAPLLAMGLGGRWVLVFPAMVSAVLTILCTVWLTRWMACHSDRWTGHLSEQQPELSVLSVRDATVLGLLAGALWVASGSGMKLMTFARPDSVLVATLTGAWLCGTVALWTNGPTQRWALGFWVCVGLAGLAKGPFALLAIVYVLLAAKWIGGRFALVHRLAWWWGFPLSLAIGGSWPLLAYILHPAAFSEGMSGALGGTVTQSLRHTLYEWVSEIYKPPLQFMARYVPWSIVTVLALLHLSPKHWAKHPMAPAIVWIVVIVGVMIILPRRRHDYLLPAYGAAATLAAWWFCAIAGKYRIRPQVVMAGAYAALIGLGIYHLFLSRPARYEFGEHTEQFVKEVREYAQPQSIWFHDTGYNALQPLLGRNQRIGVSEHRDDLLWLIQPVMSNSSDDPVVTSEPIFGVITPEYPDGPGRLGLYPRIAEDELLLRPQYNEHLSRSVVVWV